MAFIIRLYEVVIVLKPVEHNHNRDGERTYFDRACLIYLSHLLHGLMILLLSKQSALFFYFFGEIWKLVSGG